MSHYVRECPGCQKKIGISLTKCPYCGQTVGEISPQAAGVASGELPACSVCGRQDETVRLSVFPYVVSVVIMTYRRAFAGVWCRKHRTLRQLLASLITATVGWIGIPFGFIFTPVTLFAIAKGGTAYDEKNAALQQTLAQHKLDQEDAEGAVRCLEASLQFCDYATVRERLRELREKSGLTIEKVRWERVAVTLLSVLFGSIAIGVLIGVLDYLITLILTRLIGTSGSIYTVILSWTPFVTLAYMGGLVLLQLVGWGLARMRWCKPALAVSSGVVAAVLAVYGLLHSTAICDYVWALASGGAFASPLEAIFAGLYVLFLGGVLAVRSAFVLTTTSDIIYLVLLIIVAVFYGAMSVRTAIRTTRWQQRLV